jgi:hypothetical protein
MIIATTMVMTVITDTAAQDTTRQRKSQRVPTGPLLTVRTPQEERFELSLEELELDPAEGVPATELNRNPQLPASLSVVATREGRSILRVSGASGSEDLLRITADLASANPGRRVNWVMYRPDVARTPDGRVLLTHEVGLILAAGVSVDELVTSLGARARSVPGVPNAYVIDAGDPMSSLSLVEKLRQLPGVQTAYSLLKRQMLPR